MQSLPILKISYNDDIRRIPIAGYDFSSLQNQIAELFSISDQHGLLIKYKDDEGDLISICSNEELREALQNNSKLLRIYISLKDEPKRKTFIRKIRRDKTCQQSKPEENNNLPNNNSPNNNINSPPFLNFLNNPNADPMSIICQDLLLLKNIFSMETINEFLPSLSPNKDTQSIDKIVHNAFCERCDQKIVGLRWKCFECSDFDLCNDCYLVANGKEDKKSHLKEHLFGKIDNPSSTMAFQGEKERHLEKLRLKQEKERLEKEEKDRSEKERLQKEQEEKQRLEKQEKERQEKEKLEKERLKKERQEKENKVVYPFEQKLLDLQNMGFVDRKRNIQILIKYKGDMNHSIQELLDSN